jgi:hypothetical protein
MNSFEIEPQDFNITEIRNILSDDFSKNEIDRVVMAIRTNHLDSAPIGLHEIRAILLDDFSMETINRVMMTLKLSHVATY